MRTIIRCPSCFTYVYQDARACHGCGERLGKRKILRRGSWVFIGLAVSAFTIARGIDLEQEKHSRVRNQAEQQAIVERAQQFLQAWLTDDSQALSTLADSQPFVAELTRLRDRYPSVLPATAVIDNNTAPPPIGGLRSGAGVRISGREDFYQEHYQYERGKVPLHKPRGQHDPSAAGRASCVPKTWLNGRFRVSPVIWTFRTFDFEAEVRKDDAHYTVYGSFCVQEQNLCCLTIDKIVGVEGVISPKE